MSPSEASNESAIRKRVARALKISESDIHEISVLRKSIDARKHPVRINIRVEVFLGNESSITQSITRDYKHVHDSETSVHIVGAGPAGLFAALHLLEQGIKPIIIERGKMVRDRRRDLVEITRNHAVNPDSNYCFGEGGAGTYSDGKLYTRAKKRGDVMEVLETLVYHGASRDILIDAHPHIGTNKLPGIIESMRKAILECGGEILFESKLMAIHGKSKVEAIDVNGERMETEQLILATGHSARDIFSMLDFKGLSLEFKEFALGVRVEHQQSLIDSIQYHCETRDDHLPPAAYSLVHQAEGAGVYSFCMCPGGIIAPCATSEGEIVTNGWSPSKRNNPFANSGVVTQVRWEDIPDFHHYKALAGLEFQKSVEKYCWEAGGGGQTAPAQRLVDFIEGRLSDDLPVNSYTPGLRSARLDQILPDFVVDRLRKGFLHFGSRMRGYLTNEAVIVAPESRTSSPIRIPRDQDSLEHPDMSGLYPCGEGAGYAGGIVSAAMDGKKIAGKCARHLPA
jgi:uncharacterized FAD-dependent dehydrogenase